MNDDCFDCKRYMNDCDGDGDNMRFSFLDMMKIFTKLEWDDRIVSIDAMRGVHMRAGAFLKTFKEYKVEQGKSLKWLYATKDGVKYFALANEEELNECKEV